MPLEMLREPITPVGLHYLLIHFDIPAVDAASWRLEVGGRVERPLTLSLEEVKARPARTVPVTLECAGNGRALLSPRPVSQPWLAEAVGTAAWAGTPLRRPSRRGVLPAARRRSSSPASTAASRATSSSSTSGACPSARRSATACSSP